MAGPPGQLSMAADTTAPGEAKAADSRYLIPAPTAYLAHIEWLTLQLNQLLALQAGKHLARLPIPLLFYLPCPRAAISLIAVAARQPLRPATVLIAEGSQARLLFLRELQISRRFR